MRLALFFLFNFLVELKKTKSPLLFANEGEKSEKRELKSSSLLTTYRVGLFQSDSTNLDEERPFNASRCEGFDSKIVS